MAATLAKIEAHPALQLTPEGFAYQVRQAREAAQQQSGRDLSTAIARVDGAAAELGRLAVQQRAGGEQNRWLAIAAGTGAVFGVVVWVSFSGPIARVLPAGWNVPERMAAATLRLDRWNAGVRLMQSASPRAWRQIVEASQLDETSRQALAACRATAAKTRKMQRCAVIVKPQAP
jgi:hypothetical protein